MDRILNIVSTDFSGGTITGFRKGFAPEAGKITLRPFTAKDGGVMIQFTYLLADRATHENLTPDTAALRLYELLRDRGYAQAVLFAGGCGYHITHYGKLKIRKSADEGAGTCRAAASHNRKKDYGIDLSAPYLEALGVTRGGAVVPAMRDKLVQIAKFIELAAAVIPDLKTVSAIDFGCGKAYLTFALYHHLRFVLGRDAIVYGVDLKADVLANCSALAEKTGYDGLHFVQGDIASHGGIIDKPDLVVALHACDTATDLAIDGALDAGARAIILAPCCQHELFDRVRSDILSPMLRGALRERTASIITDALRILRLEAAGYSVDCVEFVDSSHTPKNLMIRAKKVRAASADAEKRERAFRDAWGLE